MTLPRDKESVLAGLPPGLKPQFLYLADQLEALRQTVERTHAARPALHIQWDARVPLPGYLIPALVNFIGEPITLTVVPDVARRGQS